MLVSGIYFWQGVECAVLEKNRIFSSHPQAHFINNRSMEVLCSLRLVGLSNSLLQDAVRRKRGFEFRFFTFSGVS